jgi:hypothetical protein
MQRLEDMADPEKVKIKQEKFGITANNALGVYQRDLKILAKEIGVDNELALELFNSRIYEARLLCRKIHDPSTLTTDLMEAWVETFENREVCDSFCMVFFARSEHALAKANESSERQKPNSLNGPVSRSWPRTVLLTNTRAMKSSKRFSVSSNAKQTTTESMSKKPSIGRSGISENATRISAILQLSWHIESCV